LDSPIITSAGDLVGGQLRSINIETRTENWAKLSGIDLPESVFGPTIGDDGTIYASMLAGGLWAFDSVDGSTKWSFPQSPNDWPVYGPLIGKNGSVFFGATDGKLYSVNSSSASIQESQWPTQSRNNENTSYGPNNFFFYSPNVISVGNEFQWIDLKIESNTSWVISETLSWVFLSRESGEGNATVSLVIEQNQTGSERSGTITIGDFELPISQSALPTPMALAPTIVSESSFVANWEVVEGASKYLLDISRFSDFSSFLEGYEQRDVSNATSWLVEELDPSTQYFYRFRAQSGSELSEYSSIVSMQTLPLIWDLSLSVKGNVGGMVEGSGRFEDETEVTIRAIPDEGYKFADWLVGDSTFSYNPVETFVINESNELAARFKPAWKLDLLAEPEGAGTLTGDGTHIKNEPATIIAVPDEAYRFVGWKIGDSDYSSDSVDTVISAVNLTLVAHFEKIEWTLTLSSDNGRIVPSPQSEKYDNHATVSLMAVPDPGYRFGFWEGDATGNTGLKDLIMNGDKSISANFVLDVPEDYQHWLDTNAADESDPSRINLHGDLDYDGLPNYIEFVLGTSSEKGDLSENPRLIIQEDGQPYYTLYTRGPIEDGRLFVGVSPDLNSWGWVELIFASGSWLTSKPDLMIVDTQFMGGASDLWGITVRREEGAFNAGPVFFRIVTSLTAP